MVGKSDIALRQLFARLRSACFTYSSSLKLEAIRSSETSVNFYQTSRHHIPEDNTVHRHCTEIGTKSVYMSEDGQGVSACCHR
jgi:hypothetical protein